MYCHQENKQIYNCVTKESIGEWQVAWSTVKAAQGPDTDALCVSMNAKRCNKIMFRFSFSPTDDHHLTMLAVYV